MRVLVADDQALVRLGIKVLLQAEFRDAQIHEAADSAQVLESLRQDSPDVAILNISMPGRGGLELLGEMKKICPLCKIIVLSAYSEDQFAVRSLRLGAAGYITKESAPSVLAHAVRKVLQGKPYVSPYLMERLAADVQGIGGAAAHEKLSDREFQILTMIGEGKSVTEIARHLALSDKTVSTYRARLLEKMGLHSTSDLIRYCLNHGLA